MTHEENQQKMLALASLSENTAFRKLLEILELEKENLIDQLLRANPNSDAVESLRGQALYLSTFLNDAKKAPKQSSRLSERRKERI